MIIDGRELDFPDMVKTEIERARRLHPQKHNSLHEGYAIILEEVDEFWDEVKKKRSEQSPVMILSELVQIGAMAQRISEDVLFEEIEK